MNKGWRARLVLEFERERGRTILTKRAAEGPLVVQKPLYPEGDEVCHAIVVHPPGGIAGGDELTLDVRVQPRSSVLLTTPGAARWYRSAGPWAKQKLVFDVEGALEWLPRETIVFDRALGELQCEIRLAEAARYIGWEILCLGRFSQGKVRPATSVFRQGKLLWVERGEIEGGGTLARSSVGLGGRTVFGTLVASCDSRALVDACRKLTATTALPGLLIARYLGDSSEEAFERFRALWSLIRPELLHREAVPPRIWST